MLPSIFGENLLDDLWRTDFDRDWFNMDRELYGKHAKNLMKTDVRESEAGYEMAIELPGFQKEDIKVDLKDGYLTVSYRPYQRLRVIVSQRPALLDVRNYAQAFRASFTALSVPYWQDSGVTTETLTGTDTSGTITPTGTLSKIPVAVTVSHSSGTLTTLTLTVGTTQMAFTGLSVAANTDLVIAYDDDYNLTIKAGSTGVMSARSAASSDHLLVTPGVENTIRVQANVSVSAAFSVRGLYL